MTPELIALEGKYGLKMLASTLLKAQRGREYGRARENSFPLLE
jgi:hypothetical protein